MVLEAWRLPIGKLWCHLGFEIGSNLVAILVGLNVSRYLSGDKQIPTIYTLWHSENTGLVIHISEAYLTLHNAREWKERFANLIALFRPKIKSVDGNLHCPKHVVAE